jgi:menaquinone-dependent protoporphyrinogen oxidase
MKILVTAASRHGSTDEIARIIGTVLRARGCEVDVLSPERVTDLLGYDAVVLGSAVYRNRWLRPAKDFVARHLDALPERTVFLFSSGPLGEAHAPGEPLDVAAIDIATGAVDHQVFAGRLSRRGLSRQERLQAGLGRIPAGDYRPWDDIVTWARAIADFVAESTSRPHAA